MAIKQYVLKIEDASTIANMTYRLRLAANPLEVFDFVPGQFVTLVVGPMQRRSYSLASLPGLNYIDLIADSKAGGPGSKFFENAKKGDEVKALLPLGNFTYKESNRPVYFFATGTGLVPFISMIDHALKNLKTQRKIRLIIGFRFEEDIFAKDWMDQLVQEYPNFSYCLSLTKPTDQWTGQCGRITEYIDTEIGDADLDAYICGAQAMITDVKEKLTLKGVAADNIFIEKYY